ncbi:MAG: hypothetical protein MUO40_14760 [Anaerolineaceae bacterium]|nr:hypothetical protein [Anaerolineaceae bacterium]
MDDKITIIEGPTPVFETIQQVPIAAFQTWSTGLFEGPVLYDSARTTLRTFNSANLIERCNQTWRERSTMYLEYRDRIGLTKQTPIMAAQAHSTEDGDILILWVRKDTDDDDFNPGEENEDPF